jgi:carbon-monoxide dehydrogenase large subunit
MTAADDRHATSGQSWVGRSIRRKEDARLLRGQGRYFDDLPLPGALAAAVLRSPHAHARLLRIDSSRALALPGVYAVLTGADLVPPADAIGTAHWAIHPAIQAAANPRIRPDRMPLLATDKAHYVGEPVAVLVADDRYLAEDALELIEVEYEPLPVLTNVDAALAPDAPLIHEEWGDNVALAFEVRKGDVEAAFAAAQVVVRDRFRSHRYTGVPIETRGVAAAVDPHSGNLTVWTSIQMPHPTRDLLASLLGRSIDQVRVVAPDVGGGFGIKGHAYVEDVLIPILALRLGRPVKWVEDRREHFVSAVHAREQLHDFELAADAEGRILGLRDRVLADKGAYNPLGMVLPYNTIAHTFGPYLVPAASFEVKAVVTNKTPHAPYRGAGRPEAVFAMERALDRLAADLKIDPAELRLRNLVPAEAMPYDTGLLYRDGQPLVYDSGDYPAMYRLGLELLEYDRWRAEQAKSAGSDRRIGIGLAGYVEGTGVGPFESGSVTIDPASGRVRVATGTTSQGQGHQTTFAQVVADVLDVSIDQVDVVAGDTAAITYGFGSVASRGMVTGGSAVAGAAGRVRDKAVRVGAQLLEASVDDVELAGGGVRVKGAPTRSITLGEIARALLPGRGRVRDETVGLREESHFEPPTVTYASGLHGAVVAVDVPTGRVEILRYVVVHDCGRVVNPLIVDGQVAGGVAQGIGGALYEDLVYDDQGQLLTTSLMDYLLPTTAETPPLTLGHQEHLSPRNPLGVKGLGEGGAIGPPAAIANAVEDALRDLGVRVRETPLGPSRVRELVAAAAISG